MIQLLGHTVHQKCNLVAPQKANSLFAKDPDAFGKALLRGTLFHEMGHALGLDHNFKGSLAWDHKLKDSLPTYSIMDYNQYHLEAGIFESAENSKGPMLEYDRQILSVLYNDAKDLNETDPTLPACNDDEADSLKGGVDPLCVRYDAGQDPTILVNDSKALILDTQAQVGATQSLAQSLRAYPADLPKPETIRSPDELMETMTALTAKLRNVIAFYYTGGAQSLAKMTKAQVRLLRTYKPQTLGFDYNAAALRTAARDNIQFVMSQDTLSVPVTLALKDATDALHEWFMNTPAFASVDADVQNMISIQLGAMIGSTTMAFVPLTLSIMKAELLSEMGRATGAPFYKNEAMDFEKEILDHVTAQMAEKNSLSAARHLGLRQIAAKVLVTYSEISDVKTIIETQKLAIADEVKSAKSAEIREQLRAILKILEAPVKSPQGSSDDKDEE